MSTARDLVVLIRHYRGVAGLWGLVLAVERAARHILPANIYRLILPVLWDFPRPGQPLQGQMPNSRPMGSLAPEDHRLCRERFPEGLRDKIVAARSILEHQFDFLGSGPRCWGDQIAWHLDIKSGYVWPRRFWTSYGPDLQPGNGVDVKMPWELSRLHHLVTLAQSWWLTGDESFSDEFFSQWESWLESNQAPYGVNWASTMEVAIRAVNLTYAVGLLDDCPGWTRERRVAMNESIRKHGAYVEHNLEFSSRDGRIEVGNHYLANLCGLACLGMVWDHLPKAPRWRETGLDALEVEIRRQVHSDGFYFEPSTSYHRLALELFLLPALSARRAGHEMSDGYWLRLERMCEAVMGVTGPDGCVPQIGDNDDGRLLILSEYPDWPRHDHRYLLALGAVLFGRRDFKAAAGACAEEVFWLLGADGVETFEGIEPEPSSPRSRGFADAGLYVIKSADGDDYALIRAGAAAPSAPVAHAHNDALSLELWVGGQPVFMDPGTICYTPAPAVRDRLRSTASHNTAMVDGQEINRLSPGAPFDISRDAVVRVLEWSTDGHVSLTAEHDGYRRLYEAVRHRRTVRYSPVSRRWEIEDLLKGRGVHEAAWFWHLPPGHAVRLHGTEARLDAIRVSWETEGALDMRLKPWQHGASYGRAEDSSVLVASATWEGEIRLRTTVEARSRAEAATAAAGGSERDVDG